jgi:hypothetical protein
VLKLGDPGKLGPLACSVNDMAKAGFGKYGSEKGCFRYVYAAQK